MKNQDLKNTVEYVLFDLDGTVSDSSEGITKSVQSALAAEGIFEELSALTKFIGPSLRYSFGLYTDDVQKRDRMLAVYRKRYGEIGWKENRLYDGMEELFDALKKAGKHVVLASAKPEFYCVEILKYFGVYKYFDFVGGATFDGSLDDKTALLKYVLAEIGNPPAEKTVMIGDRIYDIEAAHNHGIKAVGVTYGFADRGELVSADFLADSAEGLGKLLLA